MTQAAFGEPNTTLDPERCEPYNQVLLLGSNLQAFYTSLESLLNAAPLVVRMSIIVLTLMYITVGGLSWMRQDGWLATNALCDWLVLHRMSVD